MKPVLLLILISAFMASNAQTLTSGSLDLLKKKNSINLVMDFSQAKIIDNSEVFFAAANPEWEKKEIVTLCSNYINKQLKGRLTIDNDKASQTVLKIIVISVNKNGTFKCKAVLTDNNAIVAEIEDIKSGYGDLIGSSVHRIKVGSQKLGNQLGKFIGRQIR